VMQQASETGLPAMRPMVLEHPRDAETAWMQDQFYFGDYLLVAPVLWPGDTTRQLWLPEGRWYDFWDGTTHLGPAWITVQAPIERIPIFVKAGGVVPMQPVMQYVGEKPADPLTLLVASADSAAAQQYEDDGLSFNYREGAFAKRTVSQRASAKMQTISVSAPQGSYRSGRSTVELTVLGVEQRPKEVRVFSEGDPGRPIKHTWSYAPQTKSLTVLVAEQTKGWNLVISR
jgi:alpha-glucosidase